MKALRLSLRDQVSTVRTTLVILVSLGLVSFFADMAYQGSVSIRGSYLSSIGAPLIVAGVLNIGWLVNYSSRFLSGLISDYFRKPVLFWMLVFLGYFFNAVAILLLAYARSWEIIVLLIVFERFGKGLRTPMRDVIISEISEGIGRGLGFGIHGVLDQAGSVLGPLIASLILASRSQSYPDAFLMLAIPGFIAVMLVAVAWFMYPKPRAVTGGKHGTGFKGLTREYYVYILGLAVFSLGYVSWDIIGYYSRNLGFQPDYIALLYTIAMLVDGLLSIPLGALYDRVGLRTVILVPLAATSVGFLLPILPGVYGSLLLAVVWGLATSLFETTSKAAVADLVSVEKRSIAYGFYGLVNGILLFIGGLVQSMLLGVSLSILILYITVVELASLIILLKAGR